MKTVRRILDRLRSRRGESMVEILVATVVFLMLFGTLGGAVLFAGHAQQKAQQIRADAARLQREVRAAAASDDGSAVTAGFYAVPTLDSANPRGREVFRVELQPQTKTAGGTRFALFGPGGGDG